MSTVAIASAAAIPSPSIAATGPDDPIFAAIERHRRAVLDWMLSLKIQSDLEEKIPANRWQKDRRWIAACQQYDAASDERNGATSALLEIVPTSRLGVIALFDYVDEVVRGGVRISDTNCSGAWLFPERLVDDAITDHRGKPVEMPFSYWIMRNVRAGLISLEGACHTLEPTSKTPMAVLHTAE